MINPTGNYYSMFLIDDVTINSANWSAGYINRDGVSDVWFVSTHLPIPDRCPFMAFAVCDGPDGRMDLGADEDGVVWARDPSGKWISCGDKPRMDKTLLATLLLERAAMLSKGTPPWSTTSRWWFRVWEGLASLSRACLPW